MSKVDILKHSIQYIQKLRSLVESHHHQTSSSGDSLRHLVEAHHQNLVEQTQLETSTSPHPFSHQEHQSPDARYHPSTDSQFSPSSSSNNSSYPHLQQAEGGGRTNGHHYPHHGSPTSPPLMPSPDSSDSGHASLLSYHPTTFQPSSPTNPTNPTYPPQQPPPATQQQPVPQDFSASQTPSAAVGFLTASAFQQQTSHEDEILDVIAEWQES